MGDEWVAAAKKLPALTRVVQERAIYWYAKGWPGLEDAAKEKARVQAMKLAAARPPGAPRAPLPKGWLETEGKAGKPAVSDGRIARSGSYSVLLPPADPKVKDSGSSFRSNPVQLIKAKTFELSAYVLANANENPKDGSMSSFGTRAGTSLPFSPASFLWIYLTGPG